MVGAEVVVSLRTSRRWNQWTLYFADRMMAFASKQAEEILGRPIAGEKDRWETWEIWLKLVMWEILSAPELIRVVIVRRPLLLWEMRLVAVQC